MKFRPALPSDAALLRDWESRPHVRAAIGDDPGFDWENELRRDLAWRELLVAEVDGRPIGFIQIIDPAREETRYWGDVEDDLRAIDIWIGEAGDLGRGYGTRMMRLALRRCFSCGAVKAVLVDPLARNTRAHRFYERLGFRAVERRTFGRDDCLVHRIAREDWVKRDARDRDGAPGHTVVSSRRFLRLP